MSSTSAPPRGRPRREPRSPEFAGSVGTPAQEGRPWGAPASPACHGPSGKTSGRDPSGGRSLPSC
eukprot:3916723-Pyramimonas_sp.AAC.1